MTVTISMATEIDTPKIKAFIQKVGAPIKNVEDTPIQYLTAKNIEAEIVAVLGTMTEADSLVLRHLILDPKRCDMAMLLQIIEHAVAFGASNKVKRILFLTPAPAEVFDPIGFSEVNKDDLDEEVLKCLPIDEASSTTAKILARNLV